MSRKRVTLFPLVFCLFLVPMRVCAGPLGDEVKKQQKSETEINIPMRFLSAAGLFSAGVYFFFSVKEGKTINTIISGLGLSTSFVGLLGAFDSFLYFDDKEEEIQKDQLEEQDGLKVVDEKKKKKKWRKKMKDFFSREKGIELPVE